MLQKWTHVLVAQVSYRVSGSPFSDDDVLSPLTRENRKPEPETRPAMPRGSYGRVVGGVGDERTRADTSA